MTIKAELKRKALHMGGLLVPLSYLLFGRDITLALTGFIFFSFVALEPFRIIESFRDRIKHRLRLYVKPDVMESVERIERFADEIAREHEHHRVAAHIYFAAAAFINLYFFSPATAVGAITVATVGDAMAAIVGKSLGRHRFKNGKSLEGSLAYFVSGVLILWPFLSLPLAIVGSFVGMVAEFYDFPPDDNFSNQLTVSLAVYIGSALL